MLRQQEINPDERPNLSLADFVAPRDSGVPDYLGMFAVTAGIGADALARQFERDLDDYNAIMVKALADRLAEASAEYLHAQARKGLGLWRARGAVLRRLDCRKIPRDTARLWLSGVSGPQ